MLLAFEEAKAFLEVSSSVGERSLAKCVEVKVLVLVGLEYSGLVGSVVPFHY